MNLTFLEATEPLTKTFTQTKSGLVKTPYPMTWEFTSHTESVQTLSQFETVLRAHAALGHCLLKGNVSRPLVKESRKGSTDTNAATEWVCFDFDGANMQSIQYAMTVLGCKDTSYLIQYSASAEIENKDLRAHVFVLLDKPMSAPLLKQWLIHLNHLTPELRSSMSLTKTGVSIRWPLDISACQNDKLLYIAPPVLNGLADPFKGRQRITLVKKKNDRLAIPGGFSSEKNRDLTHKRIAELREAEGLPKRTFKYKMHGGVEVMIKPDSCTITEMKTERGFVYFNLNGGDSWAYYHPENNPDFIFNFKGEPAYVTKELLPEYWEQITSQATKIDSSGLAYLAFCDRRTSTYWRGTYDAASDNLELFQAKNETQVRHFAKQHGMPLGDFIPEWDLIFDPTDTVRVDFQAHIINQFTPSAFMKLVGLKAQRQIPPLTFKIINHALGGDPDLTEHFVNWCAFIIQERDRTKTAWVLHGVPGCLAGDTVIEFNRGNRCGGRVLRLKTAYEKWTGTFKQGTGLGKTWDLSLPTKIKSVRDKMTIGYHEVLDILQSGEKQLFRLEASNGRHIRATAEHPFMRPDGTFTELQHLSEGDEILIEGPAIGHMYRGGRQKRNTTYSIPHHPHAWQHITNGKNYKRSHTARIVYEANLNGLAYDEFVKYLRTDPIKSAGFKYLPGDVIVHHEDEDPTNDSLNNLVVIDKDNHDKYHAKEVGIGFKSSQTVRVARIVKDKVEMTYDIIMKAPYHNYVANGFVVHNTGKGALTTNILRPLLGSTNTALKRMEELNEHYNHWMKSTLLVVVDEVQTKALQNERGVMAKLKNFITEAFVAIRMMHAGSFEQRNYTNWIFNSNMSDPVAIDKNDRRFNVGKYQKIPLGDILTQKEKDNFETLIEKELPSFFSYLLFYPMDKVKAQTVLNSVDRSTMISLSESSIDTVADKLLAGDFEFLVDQLPASAQYQNDFASLNKLENFKHVLKAMVGRTVAKTNACSISREELRVLFEFVIGSMPTTPNKFTSLLKHHRIHMDKVWVDNKTVNGIRVVWQQTPAELQAFLADLSSSKVVPITAPKKAKAAP